MKDPKIVASLSLLFVIALFAIACDDDGDTTQPDVANDVTDMVADQPDDTIEDTTPDVQQDPVEDVAADVQADAVVDVTIDAGDTGNLFINEFMVTPTSDEAIELYNADATAVSLNGWTLEHTTPDGTAVYPFINGLVVPATGFLYIPKEAFGQSSYSLQNVGGIIALKDGAGTVIDDVAYGLGGYAPTPIYQWSTARVVDGQDTGNDAVDFNLDPTPTMGAANDVAGVDLGGSDVVMNEFFVDEASDTTDFFEFHNMGTSTSDIDDWTLVYAGDEYVFSLNTSVAASGYWVLDEADYPEFSEPDGHGNAYLFDDTGVRYQGISWLDASTDGTDSSGFLPDGNIGGWAGGASYTGLLHTLTPTRGAANAD